MLDQVATSHEAVRQDLAKYSPSQVRLLPENTVATKLGYSVTWLVQLRKEGIINPIRPGGYWLYSEEQVRQIPSLIAERRKCEHCGKLRPPGYRRFCQECSQYRKKHKYMTLSLEQKAEHIKRNLAWQRQIRRDGRRYSLEHTGSIIELRCKVASCQTYRNR